MSSTDSDEDLPAWVIAAQKFEGLSGRTASFEKEQERKRQEEEKRSLRARVEAQREKENQERQQRERAERLVKVAARRQPGAGAVLLPLVLRQAAHLGLMLGRVPRGE